ncbi:MAG: threonine--tRNA ligase [Candidatus Woesearchaeota archaeon]|nr:MAG: threonine--tRNA ligase [Candidatus Woesearchaeota archaeon]
MKVITIHSDSITYKPQKKAIKAAEEIKNQDEVTIKECLVVLTSVENKDEKDTRASANFLAEESAKIAEQVKTRTIVLYPYAHLSSDLSGPEKAIEVMIEAEKLLKSKKYNVYRAPFGWYKEFTLHCKGHPLSELSRVFDPGFKETKRGTKKIELTDKKFDKEDKVNYIHSFLLGYAVKEIFPNANLAFCGVDESGFYCDFGGIKLRKEDLGKIQGKMKEVYAKLKVSKKSFYAKEAKDKFKDSKYYLDALNDIKKDELEVYDANGLYFLSPYLESDIAKSLGFFELTDVSGVYWKNDSSQDMLQRVYGTAFASSKELEEYKTKLKEAEKRDHRKLGQELGLIMFHEYSPGSVFLLPKGAIIYNELVNFIREEYKKRGYQEVITPQIFNKKLWEKSGHWNHFKDNMFILEMDNDEASLKPMNCPGHLLIFKSKIRSYRELPMRLADFSFLHRNELKGVLAGMTRVRRLSQDDAHIFCTEEQLEEEIHGVLDFIDYIYKDVFGMEFILNLSTRPEKAMGSKQLWDQAEKLLEGAIKDRKMKYNIKKGEGAFYGPKIDVDVKDALGRNWQVATIQLDFQMPLNFEAEYEGADNKKHNVIMIHRAILGSFERFMAIMIEHYEGNFPLWLSPVQVRLLTVTDRNKEFALEVLGKLKESGIRSELDERAETIPKKVRDAEIEKIPVIVTIGDKESDGKTLAVRESDGKVKFGVNVDKFIDNIVEKIKNKNG